MNGYINYDLTEKPDNAHVVYRTPEEEHEDSFMIGSWVDYNGEGASKFSPTLEGCLSDPRIKYKSFEEIDHLLSWDLETDDYHTMNGKLMDFENQYRNNNWRGYP